MTQWEQLKKEYREIPVPEDGQHQVLKAMAEAKQKRSRYKRLIQYSTVAAAVLLVVLLLPGMFLFSGGFGASSKDGSMEADCAVESTGSAGGWFVKDGAQDMIPATSNAATAAPEQGYESVFDESEGNDAVTETAPNHSLNEKTAEFNHDLKGEQKKIETRLFSTEEREAISREILKQMEKRMQESGETYYMKSEKYQEGFEQIASEQEYYVNADGLLVIVFRAGVVAPEEQGTAEFVIPEEVASP